MMFPTKTMGSATLGLACLTLLSAGPLTAQATRGSSERDEWQRVPAIFEALQLEPGSRIADVGAGGGYFTDRLSLAVGPEGRVFAVDINERTLLDLHRWLERDGRQNVELILGEVDDPRLPYRSLDGALIVNAYHEMGEYEAMLEGIHRSLEVGGRLVIVDNVPNDGTASRAEQIDDHKIALELVAGDLEEAGFAIVDRQPDFINLDHGGHTHREWMLVAERPRMFIQSPTALDLDPDVNDPAASDFWCAFPGTSEELRERRSPPDSAEAAVGGGRLKVCYSRPSARDREIMGGLVPFGEPWRTGANEATLIHLGFPAEIAGVLLDPGAYSIYTIPGEEEWEIVFNRSARRDGMPIDEELKRSDVGSGMVSAERLDEHVEQLTFEIRPRDRWSADLVLEWENTRVSIPIERKGGD